ncbi:1-acyl-sn-glycerol-3-phosphate acyltransferase [Alphaproteobacteria bacterium]|nr:1-acyl-sn-glycerol-3-phosphate acyltransferase [Alphaproteobacteria bacterium]
MLLYIRSILFTLFFFAWSAAVSLVICVFLLPLPAKCTRFMARVWARGSFAALRVICGVKSSMQINPAILPPRPFIVAAKHQSAWETMAMHILVPKPAFILKKELAAIPLFGWALRKAGSVVVDRSAGVSALTGMVREAEERIAQRYSLVVFPEGTRTPCGVRQDKYQPGIALLYDKLKLPVVPVVLNSGRAWPKNSWLKYPGTIVVKNLEPIPPGLDRREFLARLTTTMEDACAKL